MTNVIIKDAPIEIGELPKLEHGASEKVLVIDQEIINLELKLERIRHEVERDILNAAEFKNEAQRKNALFFRLDEHEEYGRLSEELREQKYLRGGWLNALTLYRSAMKIAGILSRGNG